MARACSSFPGLNQCARVFQLLDIRVDVSDPWNPAIGVPSLRAEGDSSKISDASENRRAEKDNHGGLPEGDLRHKRTIYFNK